MRDGVPCRREKRGRALGMITVIGVIIVVLLMVWARAWYGSKGAYDQGKESLERGRIPEAITYFDRAVHWYAPFNPWNKSAAEMLWSLSERAESEGDHRMALRALTALRSGYRAASGLFSPGRDWILKCEDRIDRISAAAFGSPDTSSPTRSREVNPRKTLPPDLFWTLALEVGLFGWCGSVIWLILGHGVKKRAFSDLLKWGMLIVFFFALWIVGMMKA